MAGELKMAGIQGASEALSHFASNVVWSDLPEAVRHEAKRSLLNFFATSLAGCRDRAVLSAKSVFDRFSASQECTVIGHAQRTDALHGASLNAMSANVFDYDDTHIPTIIHPTASVAPALLALAQTRPVTGEDLLTAFAVGVEVECRLGIALSPWHYERGWHITSTCGVFGSAVATGRLLGLDQLRMLWALGHASAQSSGLVQTLGSMSKSLGVGKAASSGLLAALLAEQGFEGPLCPIEGARGFLRVMGNLADEAVLTERLGDSWELTHNTYKPYPCGVVLNPVIEACLAIHHQGNVNVDGIDRAEVTGHPLLRQRTDRPQPASGREAQVSAQHAMAMVLARGSAGLDEFSDEAVAGPEAGALSSKTFFVDDSSYGVESALITLHLRDGRTVCHHVETARGSLGAPLTDVDLERKLRTLCAWGGSGCDPQPLIDAVWSLQDQDDAGAMMLLAAG